ncbi:MAG: GNAT family N-acetyltransferase [Euryarchaeota archaeon]|nr:GNAT family N-acetyltransferase [Euryarchaeota archaeon]MDE1879446.1 GNAT family N-acetyltransferase [Euryarchaeota archaeon]
MNPDELTEAVRGLGFENIPQARFTIRQARGLVDYENEGETWSAPGNFRAWALAEVRRWNRPPRSKLGDPDGVSVLRPSGKSGSAFLLYSKTLVYRIGGRAVGVVQVQGVAVKTIAVHPDFQGQGVASALLAAARAHGAVYMDGPYSPGGKAVAERFNRQTVALMPPAVVQELMR